MNEKRNGLIFKRNGNNTGFTTDRYRTYNGCMERLYVKIEIERRRYTGRIM